MKAAMVVEAGKMPIYGVLNEPVPANEEVRGRVTAAPLIIVPTLALDIARH
jgi:hypothetical protein